MKSSFSNPAMTPSCERILKRFESFMVGEDEADVGHLVLALLVEESLGGKCLSDLGITVAGIADGCFGHRAADTAMSLIASAETIPFSKEACSGGSMHDSQWCRNVYERAGFIARRSSDRGELSSEHLLQAMVEVSGPARTQLQMLGVTGTTVMAGLSGATPTEGSLEVDFELTLDVSDADSQGATTAEQVNRLSQHEHPSTNAASEPDRVFALIDASLNRAREGLRVLEDFARFVKRNAAATTELKHMRHDLVAAELKLRHECPALLSYRDTAADVGTEISTDAEMRRENMTDVVTANARRVQESLRSLEEFGKTISMAFAAKIKQLRYRSYSLEQKIVVESPGAATLSGDTLRTARLARLQTAHLYVLITEEFCRLPWQEVVLATLQGGADMLQLREKHLADDELIRRGRWIAEMCDTTGALFILNDRADLAIAARAHGVHVGQTDGSVAATRSLLNSEQFIGVSTHCAEQVSQACDDGADYLGVGPVFPSSTKRFDDFPGLEFVDEASRNIELPWFAIGGIRMENASELSASGARRIAVSSAVVGSRDPKTATSELRRLFTIPTDESETVKLHRQ